MIPTGQRWEGHEGARAFYTELFAAFPDNRFQLSDIVVGPQGVFEVATLTGTNEGPWGGAPASGLPVSLQVLILFPWDSVTQRFTGERIWFDRGALADR
jgi:predicted ester cyclase